MEFVNCNVCGAEFVAWDPAVKMALEEATPQECLEWHGADDDCWRKALTAIEEGR